MGVYTITRLCQTFGPGFGLPEPCSPAELSMKLIRGLRSGGATVNIFGFVVTAAPAYGVSVREHGEVVPPLSDARLLRSRIESYIATKYDVVYARRYDRQPFYFGAWVPESGIGVGSVHIDLTLLVDRFEDAVNLAMAEQQLAIFDYSSGHEVLLEETPSF